MVVRMPRILTRPGLTLGMVLAAALAVPGYLRAVVIFGDSDAPAFVNGDRVLVNLAAYDLRLPYARSSLARLADPAPGDVVLVRLLDGKPAVKRVVAGPGARIAMRGNHLTIDGVGLRYAAVSPVTNPEIRRGRLGSLVEREEGNGPAVYIAFDPGRGDMGDFQERTVPEGSFFVLGSNRDIALDSRHFGPLMRERLLGKVLARIGSAN